MKVPAAEAQELLSALALAFRFSLQLWFSSEFDLASRFSAKLSYSDFAAEFDRRYFLPFDNCRYYPVRYRTAALG